jgi:hypothetical protein
MKYADAVLAHLEFRLAGSTPPFCIAAHPMPSLDIDAE